MPCAASIPLISCTTLLVVGSMTWMLSPALLVTKTRTRPACAAVSESANANDIVVRMVRLIGRFMERLSVQCCLAVRLRAFGARLQCPDCDHQTCRYRRRTLGSAKSAAELPV